MTLDNQAYYFFFLTVHNSWGNQSTFASSLSSCPYILPIIPRCSTSHLLLLLCPSCLKSLSTPFHHVFIRAMAHTTIYSQVEATFFSLKLGSFQIYQEFYLLFLCMTIFPSYKTSAILLFYLLLSSFHNTTSPYTPPSFLQYYYCYYKYHHFFTFLVYIPYRSCFLHIVSFVAYSHLPTSSIILFTPLFISQS